VFQCHWSSFHTDRMMRTEKSIPTITWHRWFPTIALESLKDHGPSHYRVFDFFDDVHRKKFCITGYSHAKLEASSFKLQVSHSSGAEINISKRLFKHSIGENRRRRFINHQRRRGTTGVELWKQVERSAHQNPLLCLDCLNTSCNSQSSSMHHRLRRVTSISW
jgi:hypothetical protein